MNFTLSTYLLYPLDGGSIIIDCLYYGINNRQRIAKHFRACLMDLLSFLFYKIFNRKEFP